MVQFVQQSPFVQLATADAAGLPYCSPKGDSPGFVRIVNDTTLLIPDRPGNRLLFGLQNILANPLVGLCFIIPGNDVTLRVGGRASISKDPAILKSLAARRTKATLAIRVHIDYAFFHCAKAFMRSKLWAPDAWPAHADKLEVTFGRYFSKIPVVQALVNREVDHIYRNVQDSVDGKCEEKP
jgi:PPOX class probable FMN-dependent enzyme